MLTGLEGMLSRLLSIGSAFTAFPALGMALSGAEAGAEGKVGESIGSFLGSIVGGTCAAVAMGTDVG